MRIEQWRMNIETYRRCFDICDEVKVAREGKIIRWRDYPAAIVSCADAWQNFRSAVMERSGKVDNRSYQRTPALESALRYLGDVGGFRAECKNRIGACAEPHAARTVMINNPIVLVPDLVFSYAYRPRTKTVIRYCRNCSDVFNVQNP